MDEDDRFMFGRVFDKLDLIEKTAKETCKTQAEMKSKLESHLASQEKKGARKEKVFYVVIAVVATLGSVISLIREQI